MKFSTLLCLLVIVFGTLYMHSKYKSSMADKEKLQRSLAIKQNELREKENQIRKNQSLLEQNKILKNLDYTETCSKLFTEVFTPLEMKDAEPGVTLKELHEFMTRCRMKQGTDEHEVAGCAYTLCSKLIPALEEKEKKLIELKDAIERNYEVLGANIGTSKTKVYYYNYWGDRKYYYTYHYIDPDKDRVIQEEKDRKRRFWSRSVQRSWERYIQDLRPDAERYLKHVIELDAATTAKKLQGAES